MRASWAERRALEKEEKRLKKLEKKRKNGAESHQPSSEKKVRLENGFAGSESRAASIHLNSRQPIKPMVPPMRTPIEVAKAQAAAKVAQTPALASLYAKSGETKKHTWMTIGTFSRYA